MLLDLLLSIIESTLKAALVVLVAVLGWIITMAAVMAVGQNLMS